MASHTEMCLQKQVAPEIISQKGKVSIILIYAIFLTFCVYGVANMKVYYNV